MGQFDTPLSPDQQAGFMAWKAKNAPNDTGRDYDLQGAYQASLRPDGRGHMDDEFKKPNHPTFSAGSKYKTDEEPGGVWATRNGHDIFIPTGHNLSNMSLDKMTDYFRDVEPNGQIQAPDDLTEQNAAKGGRMNNPAQAASKIAQHLALGGAYRMAMPDGGGDDAYGLVASSIPGRTDRHNVDLPAGSYVLPADVVSGLGEGNSMAGAATIDKLLKTGPYGTPLPSIRATSTIPHAPSAYQSAEGNYQMHNIEANSHLAAGGGSKDRVPAIIAGGEFVVPPHMVAYHPNLGGGDPNNLDPKHYEKHLKRGHEVLDKFVTQERDRNIKTLKKLPGPVK